MNAMSVTLEEIVEQRAKHWTDFHPEKFCHLCGRLNLRSWFVSSPLWNAAHVEDEQERRGYRRSGIVCPQCFESLLDAAGGGHCTWELRPDPQTMHHMRPELRAANDEWLEWLRSLSPTPAAEKLAERVRDVLERQLETGTGSNIRLGIAIDALRPAFLEFEQENLARVVSVEDTSRTERRGVTDRPAPALAFVDTETTGLDPDRHEIWEVGAIIDETEHHWFLPVDLGRAESIALRIGQFHERYPETWVTGFTALPAFAAEFAALTRGRHLVGAVISFDEERLRKLLRANGACPEWHYHLVDVEALVAGSLGLQPPWDSDELSKRAQVNADAFDRHTALGDARWAKALYEAVME